MNEISFWPATIQLNGKTLNDDLNPRGEFAAAISNLMAAGMELDYDPNDQLLMGIDLTRPEREFTVGPYTITID